MINQEEFSCSLQNKIFLILTINDESDRKQKTAFIAEWKLFANITKQGLKFKQLITCFNNTDSVKPKVQANYCTNKYWLT